MDYTLEEFRDELKALLAKALKAGHSVDEVAEMVEATLENEWE